MRRHLDLWALFLALTLAVCLVYGTAAAVLTVYFPTRPAFHSVDNPNCFPPGTEGVQGFGMCRDEIREGVRST